MLIGWVRCLVVLLSCCLVFAQLSSVWAEWDWPAGGVWPSVPPSHLPTFPCYQFHHHPAPDHSCLALTHNTDMMSWETKRLWGSCVVTQLIAVMWDSYSSYCRYSLLVTKYCQQRQRDNTTSLPVSPHLHCHQTRHYRWGCFQSWPPSASPQSSLESGAPWQLSARMSMV